MDTTTRAQRIRTTGRRIGLLGAAVLLTQACSASADPGGGETGEPTSGPDDATTAATAEQIAALEPYFDVLHMPVEVDDSVPRELVEPGSPADHMLTHYVHFDAAANDHFGEHRSHHIEPQDLEQTDGGFKVCHLDYRDICTHYTNLRMRDGLLISYDVDGLSIDGRIVVPTGDAGIHEGHFGTLEVVTVFTAGHGDVMVRFVYDSSTSLGVQPHGERLSYRSDSDADPVVCEPDDEPCVVEVFGGTAEGSGYYSVRLRDLPDVDLGLTGHVAVHLTQWWQARPSDDSLDTLATSQVPYELVWIDLATGAIVDEAGN